LGGPGVYSLSYIFSVDGTLTSSDPSLFNASFCVSLGLPQGVGTVTSKCVNPGQSVPSTFVLTYAQLPFGGPVNPTITISAFGNVNPIAVSQVGTSADTIINGEVHVHFGSTVHLTDVLVTDANGSPIPGVTIDSQGGFIYPLDAANSTPEPGGLAAAGLACLMALGIARRRARTI